MANFKTIQKIISDNNVKFVDYRFTDMNGRWHHITTSVDMFDKDIFKEGLSFDGSSVDGWCPINESDMYYIPDINTVFIDPFASHPTLVFICDIIDAQTNKSYNRDPRGIAKRAEAHLKKAGFADEALFGPEPEFFVFDNVTYGTAINESFFHIDSAAGSWSTGDVLEQGNHGHIAPTKGGYFKLSPIDRLQDMRSEISLTLSKLGLRMRIHHPEVGTAGQCELGMEANSPVLMADQVQQYKYVVQNIADIYGHTATFMPKPLGGDNGNGMHVHQSLKKNGKTIFAGKEYNGLSQEALYYIGGIIKHAKALNAFTNPTTNSYKRLIPGYEAPVMLAYAGRNRSAAIRIPAANSPNAKRVEVRFPDPMANSYLAFSAMLLAGLDGIKNKIDPGKAREEDLYEDIKESKRPSEVCGSLNEALLALDTDRKFLTDSGVFDDDMIDAFIDLKIEEITKLEHTPSPVEFEMYYSL